MDALVLNNVSGYNVSGNNRPGNNRSGNNNISNYMLSVRESRNRIRSYLSQSITNISNSINIVSTNSTNIYNNIRSTIPIASRLQTITNSISNVTDFNILPTGLYNTSLNYINKIAGSELPLLKKSLKFKKRYKIQNLSNSNVKMKQEFDLSRSIPYIFSSDVILPPLPIKEYYRRPYLGIPPWAACNNIVIIGIHGWAPIGGVLSDSQKQNANKFSSTMSYAIRLKIEELRNDTDYDFDPLSIEEIALVGHGTLENRVSEYFNNQLKAHLFTLQTADMIVFACHSQGCVVTGLLIEDLIESKRINPTLQNVCMFAMNGVHMGPFPDSPTDLLTSTKEMFSLNNPLSPIMVTYKSAMCFNLNKGVKVFAIGSWHDQVVPLYSATLHFIENPPVMSNDFVFGNLIRAVFVEADIFHYDFLLLLVRLCLKLSNMGYHNDLLVHLSGFLRGKLLTLRPGAHTTIHSNEDSYKLAAHWFLAFNAVQSNKYSVNELSTCHFAGVLNENFSLTDLNKFLILSKTAELLRLSNQLDLDSDLEELRFMYLNWTPTETKNFYLLKKLLEPLFIIPKSKL